MLLIQMRSEEGATGAKASADATAKRVTVRDIADELGLHFTTVAEAMRDSSRVSQKTRQRVHETAERMGYHADPMLAAFSAYCGKNRRSAFQGTLSWLNAFPDPEFFESCRGFYRDCYLGAKRRAEELGFRLESFWIAEPGMSKRRSTEILLNRNVAGVIVGPLPMEWDGFELDWELFRSVRIGNSELRARLSTIKPDHFGNLKLVYERLLRLGFQRIGYACTQYMDDRSNNNWSGAYWTMQHRLSPGKMLQPFLDQDPTSCKKSFLEWYRKEKPQVIMCGGAWRYQRFLNEEGYEIPKDIQLVNLAADSPDNRLAGIVQNGRLVGMTSVDYVNGAIQRFRVGLESHPKEVTLRGEWKDGFSLDPSLMKSENGSPRS
ncbi:LacI family DNA-binding transcriptional regulator [Pelagicoccus enzymogenes]|nr:LacI family DNA-binding transcriptional regulator [Pelagicoccus enzymogenes]